MAPILFLCLTEHWLCQDELFNSHPEGFHCVTYFCRTDHIRGGATIFVSNNIEARTLDISSFTSEFFFEAAAAIVDKLKIIIICIYRSPGYDPAKFLSSLEALLTHLYKWEDYTIVAGGDFNAEFDVTTSRPTVTDFLNLLRQFNCYCVNSRPTRGNNCLDNVFVNCHTNEVECSVVKDFPFSDHDGLALKINRPTLTIAEASEISLESVEVNHCFKLVLPKNGVSMFVDHVSQVNWYLFSPYVFCNSLTMFTCFFTALINIYNNFLVLKPSRTGQKRVIGPKNSWYNPELKTLKDRILLFVDLYKCTGSTDIKNQLTVLRREYKKKVSEAKVTHNSKLIESSTNKCKAAWALIKKNCNLSSKDKPLITPSMFNNFCVESVGKVKKDIVKPNVTAKECVEKASRPIRDSGLNCFKWKHVSTNDVMRVTGKLSNSCSNDYYNMSNTCVKKIISYIVYPFMLCINRLLEEGSFPDELKISRVCPVFKKGPKDRPESYRPVSLVPIFSKIIEYIVYEQVYAFLDQHNMLSNCQYGFRRGMATVDAVENLVSDITQAFEGRSFAQVTFCDLSKAFDCVDHNDLLEKLYYYGFQDTSLRFFDSYLKKRKQSVCIDGEWSELVDLCYGVPQGSVLGPLLFLISINDLPHNVICKTIMYADDTSFLNISNDFADLSNLVGNSLMEAETWFRANGYLLNKSKTENVIFSLRPYDNELVDFDIVNSVKFLGIYVDHQLNWGRHIDYVKMRLSRVVYLIGRLKQCVTVNYIRSAYFAFFQSIMKYCLLLWGSSPRIVEVLKLQKKVIRIINGSNFLEHCKPIFIKLEINTIVNLYLLELAAFSLKKLPEMILNEELHSYNTRNKHKISFHHCRLSKSLNSHSIMCKKVYNKLSHCVSKYTQEKFLTKFNDWLIMNPFYTVEEFLAHTDVNF